MGSVASVRVATCSDLSDKSTVHNPRAHDHASMQHYTTQPQPCSYLPDRQSTTLFADPQAPLDSGIYSQLIERGFRRSGEYLYRPGCLSCDACTPLRIPVMEFVPNRGQRRTWQRNRDVEVTALPARYSEEQFQLYRRYIHSRHRGGEMDNPTPESYLAFLTSSWSDTTFFEFRLEQKLLAVAVADRLSTGLSAVYTFFDPECAAHSPGNYAILWLIQEARRRNLRWLYLGYWIKECAKMAYKNRYQPFEIYQNGCWQKQGKKHETH